MILLVSNISQFSPRKYLVSYRAMMKVWTWCICLRCSVQLANRSCSHQDPYEKGLMRKKAKVQSSQAPNQLRALLSRPPTYSVTSTPRVSCSTAKKDTYKITIASPSRSASSTSVGTPVREQGPTTTVTTQCFDPTGNAAAVVAKTEESVDLSSQISGN